MAIDDIKDKAEEQAKNAAEGGAEIAEDVEEGAEQVEETAEQGETEAEKAEKKADQSISTVHRSGTLAGQTSKAAGKVEDYGEEMGGPVGNALANGAGFVGDAADKYAETAFEVKNKIGKVKAMINQAKGTLSMIKAKAKKVKEVAGKIKDKLNEFANKGKDASEAAGKASDAAESVSSVGAKASGPMKEAASVDKAAVDGVTADSAKKTTAADKAQAGGAKSYEYYAVNFAFKVEFNGITCADFQEASGLSWETSVEEIQQGGNNNYIYRLAGQGKFTPLILKRGFTASGSEFNEWLQQVYQHDAAFQRAHFSVVLVDRKRNEEVGRFNLYNAFPVKYEGPAFNAGESNIAVESVEIVYDYFEYKSASGGAGAGAGAAGSSPA